MDEWLAACLLVNLPACLPAACMSDCQPACLAGWLAAWLTELTDCLPAGQLLTSWLAIRLAGWPAGQPTCKLDGWLPWLAMAGCVYLFAGCLAAWLAGCLADKLADRLDV